MQRAAVMALALLMAMSFASCKTEDEVQEPVTSREELEAEVDFEKAEFATAEDGEVEIDAKAKTSGSFHDSTHSPVESDLPPEKVWEKEKANGAEDFTLPEEVIEAGSLGTLCIPNIHLAVSVYETDDEMEAMTSGVAHFKSTSCWDGNIGLAGHNQGVNEYFGKLHLLEPGDRVYLKTALGTRAYEVTKSVEIDDTDWSMLDRSDTNMVTMITCVNHDLSKRLCVQAEETDM